MKRLFKSACNLLAIALSSPFWVPARLEVWITGGEACFNAGSEFLSLLPGRTGVYVRLGFYRMCLNACADDIFIGFGTIISHREVRIGNGVYIGGRCTIGQVVIDDHVTIGSNVDILSGRRQHNFNDPGRPIQEQGGVLEQIGIGANSWIGNSAVIMADIGSQCVVGAGSVVVHPIPTGSLAAGNPAVVKKQTPVSSELREVVVR